MSVAELKRTVDETSPEERLFLSAYLHHKMRSEADEEATDLEARMIGMDSGDKVSLDTVQRLHEELLKAGV